MRTRRKSFTHAWKHSAFASSRWELEDKVDDFGWPPFKTRGVWGSAAWAPDVDLFVRNHQLVARMHLSGLTKDDVTIEMGNGELTIHGTWPHEADSGHEHGYRCACEFGPFFRTVPLPEGVRSEDVTVTFANGILEVLIPMPPALALRQWCTRHCGRRAGINRDIGAPLRFGGNSIWGEFFRGRIDDVRIYNRALSVAELQADMATPVP